MGNKISKNRIFLMCPYPGAYPHCNLHHSLTVLSVVFLLGTYTPCHIVSLHRKLHFRRSTAGHVLHFGPHGLGQPVPFKNAHSMWEFPSCLYFALKISVYCQPKYYIYHKSTAGTREHIIRNGRTKWPSRTIARKRRLSPSSVPARRRRSCTSRSSSASCHWWEETS